MEILQVLVSLCLHGAAGLTVLVCIGLFYLNKQLSSTVLVAILAFTFLFNFVAAILLFIYNGRNNADRGAIVNCGYLSVIMGLFVMGTAIFFAKRSPSGETINRKAPGIVPIQVQPAGHPPPDYFDPPGR